MVSMEADVQKLQIRLETSYEIELVGVWSHDELALLEAAFADVEAGIGLDRVRDVYGGVKFRRDPAHISAHAAPLSAVYRKFKQTIIFYGDTFAHSAETARWVLIHEMGHRFDHKIKHKGAKGIWPALGGRRGPSGTLYGDPPISLSPYDAGMVNDESFAQAFALAFFTGSKSEIVEKMRPNASELLQQRAIDFIRGL